MRRYVNISFLSIAVYKALLRKYILRNIRLVQAEADYQNALSGKSVVTSSIHTIQNNISVSDAGIQEAKVRMDNAEREYKRYQNLLERDAVTRQQYDAVKTNYDASKARYELLFRQKKSTALVKQEQTERLTLVNLVDDHDKWVVANYKETQTAHIGEGYPVGIEVDAIPGIMFKGIVKSVSQATGASFSLLPQDNSAGNFVKVEQRIPVRIEFTGENRPEDMKRLRAGMNVECVVNY